MYNGFSITLVTDKGERLGSAWSSPNVDGIPDEWHKPYTYRVEGPGAHCGADSMKEALIGLIAYIEGQELVCQNHNV